MDEDDTIIQYKREREGCSETYRNRYARVHDRDRKGAKGALPVGVPNRSLWER